MQGYTSTFTFDYPVELAIRHGYLHVHRHQADVERLCVPTPGPAGKAGPGLALFPGADGADRRPAGRPLRQAALASGYPRAAADQPAGPAPAGPRAVIPNENGRVVDPATGDIVPGTYATGWVARGPHTPFVWQAPARRNDSLSRGWIRGAGSVRLVACG